MAGTIDSALRWWASEVPDRLILEVSGDSVTYAEMDAWVSRAAANLADLGLGIGDRVVIYAGNCLEWCVATLSVIRAGGIVAGLNTNMVRSEIDYLVKSYEPALIVVDSETEGRVDEYASVHRWHTDDILACRSGPEIEFQREIDRDAPVMIVTTSGSTARPKGVVFSHRTMSDSAAWQALADPLDAPYRKQLVVAPMSTSAGVVPFVHTLFLGGTIYLERKFEAAAALQLLTQNAINVFTAVPIFFQRMADDPAFATADLSHIQISTTGGSAVAIELLRKWADKGVIVRQMYGQTEVGGTATVNPRRYALSHADKCGGSGMFMDLEVIDGDGNFLPSGQTGQIVVRGPGVMLGYWQNPQATKETIVDDWVRTGDIGVFDELGLLKMVDRMKDIIISGGLNISAAEVERVILEYDGVEEVAVIAVPHASFGETPCAIVYSKQAVNLEALIAHCSTSLASFKVPRHVVIEPEPLPRLASGKISKPALRSRYSDASNLPILAR